MPGPINIAKLKQTHERFKQRHKALVNDALRVAGVQAKEHVRQRSKFKRRSAQSLKDDTKTRIVKTRGGKILRLKWSKKHAPFIEYGTRRHVIKPKRRSHLVFYWRKVGCVVFAKRVMHPGTRPYKFGWNSASAAHRVLGHRLRASMTRAAEKF